MSNRLQVSEVGHIVNAEYALVPEVRTMFTDLKRSSVLKISVVPGAFFQIHFDAFRRCLAELGVALVAKKAEKNQIASSKPRPHL